ncbi:MAG: hypothetical protein FD150_2119, partial [Rhodobacteraceae bacterium]
MAGEAIEVSRLADLLQARAAGGGR